MTLKDRQAEIEREIEFERIKAGIIRPKGRPTKKDIRYSDKQYIHLDGRIGIAMFSVLQLKAELKGLQEGAKLQREEDFNEDIALYAFRYALGRMTCAVSDVVNYLLENIVLISEKLKEQIIREIDLAIKENRAGMDYDIQKWLKLKKKINQLGET